MPYMALQCFSCYVMQVKEVRKSSSSNKKWSCVLCNEKQSLRKVYNQAETAKEVRSFVQEFNLTLGQAAEAEGRARLQAESTIEDSSYNYRYEEDEDGQVNQTVGRAYSAAQKKSFKWDKFLPEEEQCCSGDKFQQSSDHMKFTTTIPEPPSRRKARPRSSSPPPKRPLRSFATSTDDAEPGSLIPSDRREVATHTSRHGNSLKVQQGNDSGSEGSTSSRKSSWKLSTVPEPTLNSSPALGSDCSPKNVKSCHALVSAGQTSKWSKYLT